MAEILDQRANRLEVIMRMPRPRVSHCHARLPRVGKVVVWNFTLGCDDVFVWTGNGTVNHD